MSSDITSKSIIATNPDEWVRWVSGVEDARGCELMSGELQFIRRFTDTLVLVRASSVGEFIVLFEIQNSYILTMPDRMRTYAALASEVYRMPVFPVLINIKPYGKPIPTRFESEFLGLTARQDYRVINLWEVEAEEILAQDLWALIPLLPTMKGASEKLIETARARVILDRHLQLTKMAGELDFALALFTEAFFGKETAIKIFGGKMLEIIAQTSLYQEVLRRGMKEGREEGREKGREEEIRRILLKQLTKRFGALDANTEESINELPVEQAENLAEAIFDFETREDLSNWLTKLQS